eukprot:TRINITY_DN3275_c0_g1_i1.p1 TRINITY_DN3275_c0_g1~~TRINITY_DN3275_c0_g1_i1.p1  ORF type:complete len:171 (-),score=47.16 TRINITY_DN3275_c0_g1_i1:229-741(-)
MKVLILVSALVAASYAEADADALYYGAYGSYGGAALGYPYAYARGYATPAVHTVAAAPIIAAPAFRTISAAPAIRTIVSAPAVAAVHTVAAAPIITKAAPLVAAARAAVPTITSSQFHSQDEDKNFAFGYSNINSARQESGNALTGVTGSYSDGFRTYNYVADGFGFRHV